MKLSRFVPRQTHTTVSTNQNVREISKFRELLPEERKKLPFYFACLSVNRDNVLVWVIFVTTPRQKLPWIINHHSRFKIIFLRTEISTHNCLYKSDRTWDFEISKITSGRREEITVLFRVSESKLRQRFSLCHIRHDTEARTSLN